jgi:XTP/dITP diphosphohydrolase
MPIEVQFQPGMLLLVATTNAGKLREIRALLDGVPLDVRSIGDSESAATIGASIPAPEETGLTFAENARLKACYYAASTGALTVAEDSGLEVDALDGAPGVASARYPGATYDERFQNLFAALEARGAVAPAQRTARFVCALALAWRDDILFEARGVVEGVIAREPSGSGGFGYDPIFFYPPYGRTLAEVTANEKARVSHRAAAFRALRAYLAGHLA